MLRKIIPFIYIIVVIEVILKFLGHFTEKTLIISTFYINYEGGFVKRGLLGSILHFLAEKTLVNPFKLQMFLIIISIFFLIFWLFKKFGKNRLECYILFGSFMLLNIIAYDMFFFVDIILILFFILQVFFIKKIRNFNIKIIVINLLNIFMILNHEVYFIFTFFPILYLLNIGDFTAKSLKKIMLLSPSFFIFLLMGLYFNGNNVDENIIIDSWTKFGNTYIDKIHTLYWTFNSKDEIIIWRLPIFKKQPLYLIGFLLNTILIFISMYIYLSKNFKSKLKYIFLFLICQYLAVLSLSVIAIDYIRWFWIANIITIVTLINVDASFSFFRSITIKIPHKFYNYNKIALLFIGLPLGGTWSPMQFLYTMPIKHFFDFGNRLINIITQV